MLIGMVVAFVGDSSESEKVAPHWKLCDGRSLQVAEYMYLFQVIGWTFGRGDDKGGRTTFALPDLRGYFLRGVDASGTRDLDAEQRTDVAGMAVGPRVGSVQTDASRLPRAGLHAVNNGSHRHEFPRGAAWSATNPGRSAFVLDVRRDFEPQEHMDPAGAHGHQIEGGDKETRPVNLAVNWMIYCGENA
jgi:hypothetical protein